MRCKLNMHLRAHSLMHFLAWIIALCWTLCNDKIVNANVKSDTFPQRDTFAWAANLSDKPNQRNLSNMWNVKIILRCTRVMRCGSNNSRHSYGKNLLWDAINILFNIKDRFLQEICPKQNLKKKFISWQKMHLLIYYQVKN